MPAFSRRDAPEFVQEPLARNQRAQGKPGARCTRSLACEMKKHTSVVATGSDGINRLSPRNGFNGFLRALLGDRALLPPSPASSPANLTPASGRQDHTTSPSASASFVERARARLTLPASIA